MPSSGKRSLEAWNKQLHIHPDLYFLFFLAFGFTGPLLNHPLWRFAEFWPQRADTTYERPIDSVTAQGDLERAKSVTRQLGNRLAAAAVRRRASGVQRKSAG